MFLGYLFLFSASFDPALGNVIAYEAFTEERVDKASSQLLSDEML